MPTWRSSSQKRSRRMTRESSTAGICLRVFDACLLSIIFLAPLLFGGRHPLGRFVFITLAGVGGVAWFTRQCLLNQSKWPPSIWANLLALSALIVVVIQIVPLPALWLERLAPRNTGLLELWTESNGNLGQWNTLSLTPSSTRLALATLIAYVLMFVSTAGRLEELADIERLVRMIALASILMSGFGLLQYFTSNGLFFWFYEYPHADTSHVAKGSFTCRNHFAHFLVLGVGPLLAWIVLHQRRTGQKTSDPPSQRKSSATFISVALNVGLGIVVLAILLSLSRGGAMALAVVSTITISFYYLRGFLSSSYMYRLALLGLLVIGVLTISGYEHVANRFDDFTSGSLQVLDRNEGRRKIWMANMEAISEGSLFGSGAGSHREIYPVYLHESLTSEYTHAENGYLQVATETGLLGIGLLGWTLVMVSHWCWKAVRNASSSRALILTGGITASLAASVVHSAVDFVWFIPSCMSLTIILAACALRLAQLPKTAQSREEKRIVWSRSRWVGIAMLTGLTAFWSINTAIAPAAASLHWDKYRLMTVGNQQQIHRQMSASQLSTEEATNQKSRTMAMVFHLRNVLARDPRSTRAHLRIAGKYLQQFSQGQQVADNAMSVEQIRDAAFASQFASAHELRQWLLRAFGESSHLLYQAHYHAKQALQLCPLQGEGYLFLASLSFLEGPSLEKIDAYLQQGQQVRPYDGGVMFEAGRQRLLLGQTEQAFNHWQHIYNDVGTHQLKIIQLLAGHLPAVTFVEFFNPNWQSLPYVWKRYHLVGNVEDWESIIQYAETTAQQECTERHSQQSAKIWHSLARMQTALNRNEAALTSLRNAYQVAPNSYDVRRDLGEKLLLAQHYRQAEPHFRWCLARRPDDAWLQNALVQATKSRLDYNRISTLKTQHK